LILSEKWGRGIVVVVEGDLGYNDAEIGIRLRDGW
jgi:hypothetical protein